MVISEAPRPIKIAPIRHGSAEYQAQVELRNEVLRRPLGRILSAKDLENDFRYFMFGAFDGKDLVACLSLSPEKPTEYRMRQVAVHPSRQGQGIGKKLVQAAEDFARSRKVESIYLSARKTAIPFYKSLGYEIISDILIEVGIPHQHMRKKI